MYYGAPVTHYLLAFPICYRMYERPCGNLERSQTVYIVLRFFERKGCYVKATEILENSHQLVIRTLEDLPEEEWDLPGACGEWSVKEVLAHLTSYEHLLVDIFKTFQGEEPSSYLRETASAFDTFNEREVGKRKYETAQQVLMEYQDLQVQSTSLLTQIPEEAVERKGTMPWYRPELSLSDLINGLAAHTRTHCEQIAQFRERRRQ